MTIKRIVLIESDFDANEIEAIIDHAERRECIHYLSQFMQKIKEAEQTGDTGKQNWFQILYCIVSLHLKSDEIYEPFGPLSVMENRRSTIVDDFTDSQLTVLEQIVGSIADHELRARISDVLWVTKKNMDVPRLQ